MIKRLIAALAFVYVSIVWLWDVYSSLAAQFTFVPAGYQSLIAVLFVTIGGIAVFRLLDTENWGVEDALSMIYLGAIALFALKGDISTVLAELIKSVVSFSAAFLLGIWAARGGGKR